MGREGMKGTGEGGGGGKSGGRRKGGIWEVNGDARVGGVSRAECRKRKRKKLSSQECEGRLVVAVRWQ
jgi:hypothetical protein